MVLMVPSRLMVVVLLMVRLVVVIVLLVRWPGDSAGVLDVRQGRRMRVLFVLVAVPVLLRVHVDIASPIAYGRWRRGLRYLMMIRNRRLAHWGRLRRRLRRTWRHFRGLRLHGDPLLG